jgi:hexosaminidase
MAMNKLNVMHWHLTDAQGYSLGDKVSKKYGLDKGALFNGATYSEDDLREVVEHASLLGIRVVPEIDGPAHVQSWDVGEPDAVVECGYHSVLLPTGEPLVPKMLDELIGHLATIFPDKNMHLGADEVSQEAFQCMRQNPTVMKWVYEHHHAKDDGARVHGEDSASFLQRGAGHRRGAGHWRAEMQVQASDQDLKDSVASYIGMVADIAKKHGKQPIFWQEAFDDYGHNSFFQFNPPDQLPRDALIQVWKGWSGTAKMPDVVAQGFHTLKSNDWYLDNGRDDDWVTMYQKDPARFVFNGEDKIHGGEACLWGEHIDSSNLFSRAYPRLSGVAERLWSQRDVIDTHAANKRLQSMRCSLTARGYHITDLHDNACEGYEMR